jgi:hypothetical protein
LLMGARASRRVPDRLRGQPVDNLRLHARTRLHKNALLVCPHQTT